MSVINYHFFHVCACASFNYNAPRKLHTIFSFLITAELQHQKNIYRYKVTHVKEDEQKMSRGVDTRGFFLITLKIN
jgi:hypothetical protein